MPKPFWGQYDREQDEERTFTLSADEITSPSQSLLQIAQNRWGVQSAKASVVPNPFDPGAEILALPIEKSGGYVTFIGKLEVRKGVLDLAAAIPVILKRHSEIRFRFVGISLPHPSSKISIDEAVL